MPSTPFSLKWPSLLWCSSTAFMSSGGKKDCKQSLRTDGLSPSRSANWHKKRKAYHTKHHEVIFCQIWNILFFLCAIFNRLWCRFIAEGAVRVKEGSQQRCIAAPVPTWASSKSVCGSVVQTDGALAPSMGAALNLEESQSFSLI